MSHLPSLELDWHAGSFYAIPWPVSGFRGRCEVVADWSDEERSCQYRSMRSVQMWVNGWRWIYGWALPGWRKEAVRHWVTVHHPANHRRERTPLILARIDRLPLPTELISLIGSFVTQGVTQRDPVSRKRKRK